MKTTTLKRALALVGVLALLGTSAILASEDIAKKEGQKCTACHDKAGSKLLTSKGKYYEYKKTLAGYDDVLKQYKKCTTCHAKEPGSTKLTAKGQEMKAKGVTMDHVGAAEPAK
jgi:hypothetical protein